MPVHLHRQFFTTLSREKVWEVVGDIENLYRQCMILHTLQQSLVHTDKHFFQQKKIRWLRGEFLVSEFPTMWHKLYGWKKTFQLHGQLNIEWTLEINDSIRVIKPDVNESGVEIKISFTIAGGTWIRQKLATLLMKLMLVRLCHYLKKECAFLATKFKTERRYARFTKVQHYSLVAALRQIPSTPRPELVKLIETFIRHANDSELLLLNSDDLSIQWSQDRRETLQAFLATAQSGLWHTRWALYCDSCSTLMQHCALVSEIPERLTCLACRSEQVIDAAHHARLRFQIHPSIRPVPLAPEILGNPSQTVWVERMDHDNRSKLPETGLTLHQVLFTEEYRRFFAWDVLAPKQIIPVTGCTISRLTCPVPKPAKISHDEVYQILDQLEAIEKVANDQGLICIRQNDRQALVLGFSSEDTAEFRTSIKAAMADIVFDTSNQEAQVYLRSWSRRNDVFIHHRPT